MIVNHKRNGAGLLTAPCIKDGQIVKTVYLYPGHNDIPAEDWEMIKDALADKIKSGDVVVYEKEAPVVVKKASPKAEISGDIDLLTEENFPYNEVVEILKAEGMYEDLQAQKKKETKSKTLSKAWLVDYFKEVTEDWEVVLSKLNASEEPEETAVEITALTLDEMDGKKALEIITDTFNLDTLEGWKAEVNSPDLRTAILNQIDEITKAPTK